MGKPLKIVCYWGRREAANLAWIAGVESPPGQAYSCGLSPPGPGRARLWRVDSDAPL